MRAFIRVAMVAALAGLLLGGGARAQSAAPPWYLVWNNAYLLGPALASDSTRPQAVTPLVDGRCAAPLGVTDRPVEPDRESRPLTPAIWLTDQPPREGVVQDYDLAFPEGRCPGDAPRLLTRWDRNWRYDLDESAHHAVLAAAGGILPEPLEIWTARSWRTREGTQVAWAFVISRGEEPGAWALAGVEQVGETYRTLSARRAEGWADPAFLRPELVALVDLVGSNEPELVTVEPLAAKTVWSEAATARVYGRSSDGTWAVVQEIPLMEYIWW